MKNRNQVMDEAKRLITRETVNILGMSGDERTRREHKIRMWQGRLRESLLAGPGESLYRSENERKLHIRTLRQMIDNLMKGDIVRDDEVADALSIVEKERIAVGEPHATAPVLAGIARALAQTGRSLDGVSLQGVWLMKGGARGAFAESARLIANEAFTRVMDTLCVKHPCAMDTDVQRAVAATLSRSTRAHKWKHIHRICGSR